MNDIRIGVRAFSHFYMSYEAEAPVAELKDALKNHLREPLRRADRFIQLALLGSARCMQAPPPDAGCAVVLTSNYGPVSNNALVQQQLFVDALIPRPIHFVNTLGNAAGFYIARNLGLDGANHFVSGRHGGFAEALLLSAMLLRSGTCQVLIGAVDECVAPYWQHRQRIGVTATAAMAEGSHWLLLTAPDDARAQWQLQLRCEPAAASDWLLPPIHYGSELAGNLTAFCEQTQLQRWTFSDAALWPYPTITISHRAPAAGRHDAITA